MPMVKVSNGGTSQGNPPTAEISKAVTTSNSAPVIIPTFGHNMQIKESGSSRMHVYGIKIKDFNRDNSLIMSAANWNSSLNVPGFTDLGMTSTTAATFTTKDYDLISLHVRSSSNYSNTVYVSWE